MYHKLTTKQGELLSAAISYSGKSISTDAPLTEEQGRLLADAIATYIVEVCWEHPGILDDEYNTLRDVLNILNLNQYISDNVKCRY